MMDGSFSVMRLFNIIESPARHFSIQVVQVVQNLAGKGTGGLQLLKSEMMYSHITVTSFHTFHNIKHFGKKKKKVPLCS